MIGFLICVRPASHCLLVCVAACVLFQKKFLSIIRFKGYIVSYLARCCIIFAEIFSCPFKILIESIVKEAKFFKCFAMASTKVGRMSKVGRLKSRLCLLCSAFVPKGTHLSKIKAWRHSIRKTQPNSRRTWHKTKRIKRLFMNAHFFAKSRLYLCNIL